MREPLPKPPDRKAARLNVHSADGDTGSSATPGRIEWNQMLLRLQEGI
jgi:hypothetical protein